MIRNYYLDESGNSGDLAKIGRRRDFGGQPFFVLACLGVANLDDLGREIGRLKKLHRIQSRELKASVLADKPQLAVDLVTYLERAGLPVLIEVVDKRFQVCINIVNHHVLPPVGGMDMEPATLMVKNVFVEHLYATMPQEVLDAFLAACLDPTRAMVRASLGGLAAWLFRRRLEDQMASLILRGVAETLADCDGLEDGSLAYLSYLPSPDGGKSGKPFWMLPNLSCFTDIYARLNRRHGRQIANLTLIHDELLTYDHILQDAKAVAEGLACDGIRVHAPHADYVFTQAASLAFASSSDHPGIQAADMLAGLVMRRMKDGAARVHPRGDPLDLAFHTLVGMGNSARGTGINFVAPGSLLASMGIAWLPN
jgi:hypothetical protein